jgi:iron complex outermembrane receptor protein
MRSRLLEAQTKERYVMGLQLRVSGAALALSVLLAQLASAQDSLQGGTVNLPPIDVGTTRLGGVIVGASSSVITAEDIAHSPAQNLPDILAQEAGIQTQHLYSATNGTGSTVDLRGFGVFAPSNVLILVNGRRYQDFDLKGFDFSTIPLNSIERIEITRGNSGAVLWGDGAIGGVINIVTKTKPQLGATGRVEALGGSYAYREGRGSAAVSLGPWSASVFGNAITSHGYRANSDLWDQNIVGSLNYHLQTWGAYLNVTGDTQRQSLPGPLPNASSAFVPFWLNTPRESNTSRDWAKQQGINLTTGINVTLGSGVELIVDGGVRRKFQQATFYSYSNFPTFVFDPSTAVPMNYVDTVLTTSSITPRLDVTHGLFGVANHLLTGIDLYNTQYNSDRPTGFGMPAVHTYDIRQTTLAFYAMNTTAVRPDLDISAGGRVQNNTVKATDIYNAAVDPSAGFYASSPQAPPLDTGEWQYAAHLGADYRVNPWLTLFGRGARAFRLGNADERVGAGNPFGFNAPANFGLKTQTSEDIEGGVRISAGALSLQSSVYAMWLNNEIHFIPALFQDVNLDPTQRIGWETAARYQLTETVRLRGAAAYTDATFREGPYAGNEIPVVSRWSGSAGATWDIVGKFLVLDVNSQFFGPRRMDNDQLNVQPLIPAQATVDIKIGGQYEHFFWSVAALNIFNVSYFDYAIASGGFPASLFGLAVPPTIGAFNAYPLATRTFLLQAGATF